MLSYTSTFVRYERRGGALVPVRVTKQWVNREERGGKSSRKFLVTRVTEVPWRQLTDREPALDAAGKPVAWASSARVETRERLQTLWQRGDEACEPIVREAGYDQCWLPLGDLSKLTWVQANQKLAGEDQVRA